MDTNFMIKDKNNKQWNVVIVTPAGREKYLSILKKYIYRDMFHGIIDGWQLWKNTGNQSDIEYMQSMVAENPKVQLIDQGYEAYDPFRIFSFFKYANDPNTIYLRFDDDIVFVEGQAIQNLISDRLENPDAFVVSANIVDNSLISYIHQKIGALGTEKGNCCYARLDDLAISSSEFIEYLHQNFIKKNAENELNKYSYPNWHLTQWEPFSISCFAFFGSDLQNIDDRDEEMYISSRQPQATNRPNIIAGDALVVHFAYHTQRDHMNTKPEYYEYYKKLSDSL